MYPSGRHLKPLLYIALFLSGAAALTDEIIWTRLLLLVFGSTTHSVVAVLSAFMMGLAIGSFVFGKLADKTERLLRLYAILEGVTGIAAMLSLPAISLVQLLYTGIFHIVPSPELLFLSKFILTLVILLPATIAMGGTLPVLITYLAKTGEAGRTTGRLYAVNTFGAVLGTLVTGFLFIELFGLYESILLAGSIHIAIGVFLYTLFGRVVSTKESGGQTGTETATSASYPEWKKTVALFAFGMSGLTAMAYEVAWTRLLTPTTGTYIYAFSLILAVVLSGIAIGSALATKLFFKTKMVFAALGVTQIGMWMGAILSLFANSQVLTLTSVWTVALTILPAAICMGMTFPIIAKLPHNATSRGSFIGTAYAANTIGSLIGPVIAGYILLSAFGTIQTILILAFVNGIIGITLLSLEESKKQAKLRKATTGVIAFGIIAITILAFFQKDMLLERSLSKNLEKFKSGGYAYDYKEDETAATLAYKNKDGSDYGLLVDGVGMTVLVDETKLMAHIPLLIHPNPKDMLVICFGMGTTFRSAMSYGINVDAVELVPSVPKTFPIFFPDAALVRANPKGNVLINDGRNYVLMTDKKYDVIAVDPPPPVNAAGTSVLYSREFYEQGKKNLRPGGLFLQWLFYGTRHDDFQMLVKSFIDVFPYVAVFHSPRAIGIYVVGSNTPINHEGAWVPARFAKPAVTRDIQEWINWQPTVLKDLYFGDRSLLENYTKGVVGVTDDHPKTEYFLLRHYFKQSPIARDEVLVNPPKK